MTEKLNGPKAPAEVNKMPRLVSPKQRRCTARLENYLRERGWSNIAGCDEVGRGALMGPLVAAAVILDPTRPISGINDFTVWSCIKK